MTTPATPPTGSWADRVRDAYPDAEVDEGFGPVTVDVPARDWVAAAGRARDELGCGFFDFLSAVDEGRDAAEEAGGAGDDVAGGGGRFRVVCHLAAHRDGGVRHLVLRTRVAERVGSVAEVYAGARWHERETAEMFGIEFTGPDDAPLDLEGLLLPEGFEGHPLRKDFVLASRVAKPWPGAKEPGESDHDAAPSRRRTRPPGVPDDWGADRGAP